MAPQFIDVLDQSRPPSKTILLLAWPTVMEQLLQTMVGYVDTAMVGSLGAWATAAVAINASLTWLINGLMNAATLGFSIQVARHVGNGDLELSRRIVRQAMLVLAAGGLGLTLFMQLLAGSLPVLLGAAPDVAPHAINYLRIISSVHLFSFSLVMCGGFLRCAGDTRTPLQINIMANLANVCGNFFLIFPSRTIHIWGKDFYIWGAGLGVEGAAAATAFSILLAGTLLFLVLFRKNGVLGLRIRGDYRKDNAILKTAFDLGLPAALERVSNSSGQLVLTRLVAGLGTVPLAAYYLCNTLESISYLPGFGFAIAATTLVGQSLGAGEKELAKTYGKHCITYCTIMMGIAGCGLYVFARPLIGLFTPDIQVIALGIVGLRIMAFAQPFSGLGIVISGILRAGGDTKNPFLIMLSGMWLVRMCLVILLSYPLGLGIYGAWIAMIMDLIYRGVISYRLYRKGKWLYLWNS